MCNVYQWLITCGQTFSKKNCFMVIKSQLKFNGFIKKISTIVIIQRSIKDLIFRENLIYFRVVDFPNYQLLVDYVKMTCKIRKCI